MHFGSMMSGKWKTIPKTVVGILSLFVIVLILPKPVDALQTALVRASDGNVYQIRFPNGNLSGGYNTGDFIDGFSIYDETGTVELCPGNDQSVTRELYTAAHVLAQTPRNVPVFDTSPLADALIQTAKDLGIDQEGGVDVVGIVGDIVGEMAVDELQGQIQSVVDPSLNLGIATINLNTFKIKINVSGPDIIVKPTEFLARLVSDEIELRWMLYAFSRASTYANTTIHLQTLANHRATALWDAINAGEVVDIAGHDFTIHEDAIRISNEVGVFDPFRLRLAAGVYRAYAEYVAELGTDLAEHEGPVATLANRISVDIITEFLFTLSDAQSAIAEKDALDELDAQIPGDINTRLHANINSIYDSATSDLTQHGFCSPDLRFTSIPRTVAEGDTLTYTVALNSVPSIVAAITISSNNPDVMVSPASLTFTPNNWYIPKRVVVDVSADADSIDESVSLKHIIVGYGGGMVRDIQFDITDQVSNQAPEAANTIPDQTLTVGDSSAPLDLPTYFHDPDGDTLTYTVVSSDPNVATAQRVGSQLTIWTLNAGNTILTVRVTDPNGLSATQTFSVTVAAAEVPTERPTPQGLNVGDAVIVQNTIGLGLNIRSDPWIPNDGTDNRIGKAYDGATGTIRNGTQLDTEGRTWWQVEWDTSDKVQWQHQPANQQGWSVEAIGKAGLLARRPPEPVTQSFDLVIESLSVSKNTLNPSESFTLSITIRNDGPGDSPGPALSYYHSSAQGFSPTDPPQLQGTVSLGPLASGESTTRLIQLVAPSTPKTYYYGAWLAANTADTNLNNDVASETGVTVIDDTTPDPVDAPDPVDTSEPPDLVIASISVDYDTMYPGERFTVSATVRNAGGRRAANARLRYYRSSDATFSSDDEELGNTDDFIGGLEGGETSDETANLDAPDTQGIYYYIARAEPVRNEENTDNNYDAVAITVLPPAAPDYVIVSLTSNRYLVDPGKYFRLDATVLNQGEEDARETVTVRFYRSLDPIPSPDDEEVRTDTIRALRDGKTDYGVRNGPAPEQPGAYYYYACVDAVSDERITDNNCSDVVTINVRGPDLVVNSVLVDYNSRTNTVHPNGFFELRATVRNQGTDDADDSTLRYYVSSDSTFSSDDTEVATKYVFSLDENETSKIYRSLDIRVPYKSGFFYALVCVDSVADESDTSNNCYASIKLTVRNFAPQTAGTIPAQTLTAGTSMVVDVSDYFTDGNNDNLTYTPSSSDPNIAMASVSGAQVTLTPRGSGSATITVTASDSELTATQTFSVSVMETKTPDLLVESVSLEKNTVVPGEKFRLNAVVKNGGDADASNVPIRFYQSTDNTISATDTQLRTGTLAVITADGMRALSVALTAPDTPGTYYYGVGVGSVADESDTTNNYSIGVALTVENRAPSAVGTLPSRTLSENDAPMAIDVAAYFNDPDNTALTYTAASDNTAVVLADVSGSQATLTPVGVGNASVTVTASDGELTARQTISVSVIADLPEETWMPDANLRAAVRAALGLAPNDALTPQAMLGLINLRYRGSELSDNEKIVDLTGLEYALNLDHLNLYAHLISDILPLEKLTKLRSLWLAGNRIANIRPLTSLPLGELGLGRNPITDFTPLAELTSLTRLDFWGNELGDTNFFIITRLTQLTQLDLRNNQISDITSITKLVNLKKLRLKGNPILDTSPLRDLLRQNSDLEIDIEISDEPPTKPDPEIETEGPDLVIESLRVNSTTVAAGDQFRLDVVIRNQGKAASGAATIRFYRSSDETISTVDTQVTRSSLPAVAANASKNKWVHLTAPNTAGVYYYGVCVDGVADENDTENNCSTAVKITVGTPAIDEPPVDATSLAKQVFNKHSGILRRQDVKEVLPNVLTALKEPDIQPLLIPATINFVIADPDLLKKTVPTISDEFITLLKQDAEIKTLLSDPQVQSLLQTPAAIDELAKLLGISVAPSSTPGGTVVFRDANLANKVREALNLPAGADIPKAKLATLTYLDASVYSGPDGATAAEWEKISIKNLTGLEHAKQLKTLVLVNHYLNDITPLAGLMSLERLDLAGKAITNISPLRGLRNLRHLFLTGGGSGTRINDPTPLASLTGLESLALFGMGIDDNYLTSVTSLLARLTNLRRLDLAYNRVSNANLLAGLTRIRELDVRQNQIRDVTPLAKLTNLEELWVGGNPITNEAQFQEILRRNPDLKLYTKDLHNAPAAPFSPNETKLLPNYPNPFNPETWIPYQLVKATDVTVTIYAVRGVVVRRLALGHKPAGFYQSQARAAHWDGRNEMGEKVASGLYFYTFTAGDFTATGKMLIRK